MTNPDIEANRRASGQFGNAPEKSAATIGPLVDGPRIIASVQLQEASGDYIYPVGERIEFDVTDIVKEMTAEQRANLFDDDSGTDDLFYEAQSRGRVPNWEGKPFAVRAEAAIAAYNRARLTDEVEDWLSGDLDGLNNEQAATIVAINEKIERPPVRRHQRRERHHRPLHVPGHRIRRRPHRPVQPQRKREDPVRRRRRRMGQQPRLRLGRR